MLINLKNCNLFLYYFSFIVGPQEANSTLLAAKFDGKLMRRFLISRTGC